MLCQILFRIFSRQLQNITKLLFYMKLHWIGYPKTRCAASDMADLS